MKKIPFSELNIGDKFMYVGLVLIKSNSTRATGFNFPSMFLFNSGDRVNEFVETKKIPLPLADENPWRVPLEEVRTEFKKIDEQEIRVRYDDIIIRMVQNVMNSFFGECNNSKTREIIARTIKMNIESILGIWIRDMQVAVCHKPNNISSDIVIVKISLQIKGAEGRLYYEISFE